MEDAVTATGETDRFDHFHGGNDARMNPRAVVALWL
jgi:hypothetical protein